MIVENQRRTTQIVAAYVRKNLIQTDQIAGLINSVHSTLSGLGKEVVEEPPRVPAVSVRRSVHADYIICIECGYKGKMLKRHLQSRHGLSVAQYKTRWKLPSDYSTTAANYSEQRSQLAKQIGLGRTRALSAATTTTEKPSRRRSVGSPSMSQIATLFASDINRPQKSSRSTRRMPTSSRRRLRNMSSRRRSSLSTRLWFWPA
jgi:predicted transcriptional regulator